MSRAHPDYQEMTDSIEDLNGQAIYKFLDGFGCPTPHCFGRLQSGREGSVCTVCHTTVVPRN